MRFDLDELLLLAEAPQVGEPAISHAAVGGAVGVDNNAGGMRSLKVAHAVPLQNWGGGGGGGGGGSGGGVGGGSPPPIYRSASVRAEGGALGIVPPSPGKACGMAAFDALETQMEQLSTKDSIASQQPSMTKPLAHPAPPEAAAMRAAWRGDAAAALPAGGCRERAFGCSALHLAALGGHAGAVGALRAGGAPLSPAGGLGGASPLHAAAARGAAGEAAALALLATADSAAVEAVCGAGISALHLAAWMGSLRLLEALLQARADPARRSDSGLSALEFAALGGNAPCVEALLRLSPSLAAVEVRASHMHDLCMGCAWRVHGRAHATQPTQPTNHQPTTTKHTARRFHPRTHRLAPTHASTHRLARRCLRCTAQRCKAPTAWLRCSRRRRPSSLCAVPVACCPRTAPPPPPTRQACARCSRRAATPTPLTRRGSRRCTSHARVATAAACASSWRRAPTSTAAASPSHGRRCTAPPPSRAARVASTASVRYSPPAPTARSRRRPAAAHRASWRRRAVRAWGRGRAGKEVGWEGGEGGQAWPVRHVIAGAVDADACMSKASPPERAPLLDHRC